MSLGLLTIHLHLPGCASLKEKRGRLKPLLTRLHREFNISAAEIDQPSHPASTAKSGQLDRE
jgi:uncharacterized protein YlxP (DUF503 family)